MACKPERFVRTALALGCVAAAAAFASSGAAAQAQQVYRYVDKDGHVVYTDRVPGSDAKEIQTKRLGTNSIQTSDVSGAAREAQERFPVKLYTFPCGEICTQGEALLNRRGVPYTTVAVDTPEGSEQLMKATGELQAPVLQIGDKQFAKGYSEARWQAMLDEAGYPKAPPVKRAAPAARAPPEATAASAAPETSQTVNAPGTGSYPKQ